jgi:hypothetical protein
MEMPTEQEMLPKDKYTVFDRKVKRYRKGIHSELLPYVKYDDVVALGAWRPKDSKWWMRRRRSQEGEQTLTICRGTEVDKSQPKTKSSRFLSGERRFCVHYMLLYGLHGIWRISGIKNIPNSTFACKGYDASLDFFNTSLHSVIVPGSCGLGGCEFVTPLEDHCTLGVCLNRLSPLLDV